MLYTTTRNDRDAFTAQRVLSENRGPDGGMYLPFQAPAYTAGELDAMAAMPMGQRIAEVLNRLFQCRCTGWDVDFRIGRSPVRLSALGYRVQAAELWHTPGWCYDRLAAGLAGLPGIDRPQPEGWLPIAIRVAVLFGVFGQLRAAGMETADISVVSGDFSWPISACYARQWGLPVGQIICCCNENSELWSLFSHGQLRTDVCSRPTAVPQADVGVPEQLERLIYAAGGTPEVERYLQVCRRGGVYAPGEGLLAKLRKGISVSVVSTRRILETIPSVYRTHGYVLAPGSALAYAGLMDYRAKTGRVRDAVLLAQDSPRCHAGVTARALGISEEELEAYG